ncbi:MAG: polymer-forming cytoskeletal protein [Myxococcales bacterium]|nr:polymer-forming cytoskeletal protein [Myxococcales bacterium]
MMRRTSILPAGVTLVGEIEGDADLIVRGRVEGPIHVSGALVIEATGIVRGHVRARSVLVRGVLKGNAFGDDVVRVEAGAKLVGELTAPRVTVVPGAQFRGQVHVGEVGDPRLSTYDPTLHTFSGWPAPTAAEPPRAEADWVLAPTAELWAADAASAPAMAETEPAATGPTTGVTAAAAATATVALPPEELPPEALEAEAPADVDETLSEARPPTLPPERAPLRMPRIGRSRARRREWT